MKPERTDLRRRRWSQHWIAGPANLAVPLVLQSGRALALILWLSGISAPWAHARDLDPQLVGTWPSDGRWYMSDVAVQEGFAYCLIRAAEPGISSGLVIY